jgi:hypothetical protein
MLAFEVGTKLGRLKILSVGSRCLCECDCGVTKEFDYHNLRSGRTKSCGCFRRTRLQKPTEEVALTWVINNYRGDARKGKHEWHLEREYVRELIAQNCHYCERAPENCFRRSKVDKEPYFYSGIDRVDNNLGYTRLNAVPCCFGCNSMKGKLSASAFIARCKQIVLYAEVRSVTVC